MTGMFREASDGALRVITVIDAGFDMENNEIWLLDSDGDCWCCEMSQIEAENYLQELFSKNKLDLSNRTLYMTK